MINRSQRLPILCFVLQIFSCNFYQYDDDDNDYDYDYDECDSYNIDLQIVENYAKLLLSDDLLWNNNT